MGRGLCKGRNALGGRHNVKEMNAEVCVCFRGFPEPWLVHFSVLCQAVPSNALVTCVSTIASQQGVAILRWHW